MELCTLDKETYYDKKYSLSKMTTEEYIRDHRFEVIGFSLKFLTRDKVVWFSGTHAQIKEKLHTLDWSKIGLIAHNCMFDAAILSWMFDVHPKALFDTLSMARAIHGTQVSGSLKALAELYGIGTKGEEVIHAIGKRRKDFSKEELARYAEYCKNDVVLTEKLFSLLAPKFILSEMKLIDLTLKMFTEPKLVLDREVLETHLVEVKENKARLLSECGLEKEELASNPKFAIALRNLGVEPPMKTSPATGEPTYAFAKGDQEFKDLLEHEDERVQALVAARMGVKSTLAETRTERFIGMSQRGPMPIPLRYYAAHTGRWGGSEKVNMQNLPRSSPIKKAIKAPPGYVLIDCDSSQIEARMLAWFSGQEDLVAAFSKGEDVYKIMASSIYGKIVEEIAKGERQVGKVVVLGAGYGLGADKLQAFLKAQAGVEVSLEEAKRIITIYRNKYKKIPELWMGGNDVLTAIARDATVPWGLPGIVLVEGRDGIRLPNGLYIKYPNLGQVSKKDGRGKEWVYDDKKGRSILPKRIYGAGVVENVIQGLARIVVGEQMLEINKRYEVKLTVHDSVICLAPEHEKEEAVAYVEQCMRTAPKWAEGLPVNCESKVGVSYGG